MALVCFSLRITSCSPGTGTSIAGEVKRKMRFIPLIIAQYSIMIGTLVGVEEVDDLVSCSLAWN